MLKPSAEVNNCYLLQKKLGEDFCAEHWLALAVYSPNRFLLRFVKDRDGCRALQDAIRAEAIAAYRLEAEALVPLIEVDYYQERLFISTEYRDEISLPTWLKTVRAVDPSAMVEAVALLSAGLEQYHARGMAFASLLPHNILVAHQGRQGSDFRIVGPGNNALLDSLRAAEAAQFADAAYLAPEIRLSGVSSPAGDVYSLGVLLAALLANGDAAVDLSAENLSAEGLARRGVHGALVPVILKAVDRDPKLRYASGASLEAALREALRRLAPAVPAPEAPAQAAGAARERPALPVSEARPEVLNYFQEISADYRSAQGLETPRVTAASAGLRTAATVPTPKPTAAAPTGPGRHEDDASELVPLEEASASAPAVPAAPASPTLSPGGTPAPAAVLPVRWQYRQVPLGLVVAALEKAVQRAGRGQGDFRYIGEPEDQAGRERLAGVFGRTAGKALVVEVGPLAPEEATSVGGFLRAFNAALAGPLAQETLRSRNRFARLLRQKEVSAYFNAPLPEPPDEAASWEGIIDGLTVFGRKSKPLVVLIRGSERIGGDLSAFLQLIAPSIRRKPVCFFIFGREFPTPLRGYKTAKPGGAY